MKISVFDDGEQVGYLELSGDISDYDIIINSSTPVDFPGKKLDGEPPEPPEIPLDEIEAKSNKDAYRRLKNNSESLPSEIRTVIYQCQVMTRGHLDTWLVDQGYSTRSGAVRETLVVLDSVTEEINRIGRDNEMQIIWTGET